MKLLYITFIDTHDVAKSGSSVRALKMLEAFRALGVEIMLLEGWNKKGNRKKRSEAVEAMRERLAVERPDACYVELPIGPIFFHADRHLLRMLREQKIPIAYFYGDAYWRFPEFSTTGKRRSLRQWLKDGVIYWMQRYSLRLYESTADIIYYPSAKMAEYFDFPCKKVSFPGTEILSDDLTRQPPLKGNVPTGFYVGAVSFAYGTSILLGAFKLLNDSGRKVRLIMVCNPDQWAALPESIRELENCDWLERHTAFGDDRLNPLYAQAHFACHSLRKNSYSDFAMPIKIFEYLSYGKPMISTDCEQIASFIRGTGVGVVSADNEESYAQTILSMIDDEEVFEKYRDAAVKARLKHTWLNRASAIIEDLEAICSSDETRELL